MSFDSIRSSDPRLKDLSDDEVRYVMRQNDERLSNVNDAELDFALSNGYQPILPKQEKSFLSNSIDGLQERAVQIGGKAVEGIGNYIEMGEKAIADSLGGFNPGIRYDSKNGLQASWFMDPEKTNIGKMAADAGKGIAEIDTGYVPSYTWERLKESPTAENVLGYIGEQGIKSIPDLVAAGINLPAYISARNQEIADQRATNSGRDGNVTSDDMVKAAPAAIGSALLERFLAQYALTGAKTAGSAKDIGTEVLKATGVGAGTEAIQEGGIEYLGETLGTGKEVNLLDAGDRALAGAVAGGPLEGGLRGISATYETATGAKQKEQNSDTPQMTKEAEDALQSEMDQYRNQDQENADGTIDLLKNRSISFAGNQARQIHEAVSKSIRQDEIDRFNRIDEGIKNRKDQKEREDLKVRLDSGDPTVTTGELTRKPYNAYQVAQSEDGVRNAIADRYGLPNIPEVPKQIGTDRINHDDRQGDAGRRYAEQQQDFYSLDPTSPNPSIPKQSSSLPNLPENYADARLQNPMYRGAIEKMAGEIQLGGDSALVPDMSVRNGESDKPGDYAMTRTPSVNPDWFKEFSYTNENGNQSPVSVLEFKRAIGDALDGKSLSEKQKRIVTEALNLNDGDIQAETAYEYKFGTTDFEAIDNQRQEQLDRQSINDYFPQLPQRPNGDEFTPTSQEVDRAVSKSEQGKMMSRSEKSIVDNLDMQAWTNRSPKGKRIPREGMLRDQLNAMEAYDAKTKQAIESTKETEAKTQTGKVEGEKIDAEWTRFHPDSGTLNIPRGQMPQVKAEHRGALVNFINSKGIKHSKEEVLPESLKPTQEEFSPKKVEKAKNREGGDRSILVSSDNHVLDGHHQWLSKVGTGDNIGVIRFDAPIKDLVGLAHEFPSSEVSNGSKPIDGNGKNPDESRTNQETKVPNDNGYSSDDAVKGVEQSRNSQAKIEDFGEVLEGAKKFTYSFNEALSEDIDTTTEPLSKSFPKPDAQKLIDGGVSKLNVLRILVLRASIPNKPRMKFKVSSWAEAVDAAREIANVLTDPSANPKSIAQVERSRLLETANIIGDAVNDLTVKQIEALSEIKIEHNQMGVAANSINDYSGDRSVEGLIDGTYYNVELPNGRRFNVFEKKENAIKFALSKLESPSEKLAKFDIYSAYGRPPYTVGKKVAAGKYLDYKDGFKTSKEARDFIQENNAELVEWLKQTKATPAMRKDSDNPRVGEDYRNDKDVTPEMFSDAFGFRGVQFGNWVEGVKRQADLNNAFDGLMDLANIIGVPPKALSLNGELGLAFGARGSGGKNSAKAHYESHRVVINLTKKNGSGSLAHEWFHALDNYFAKMENAKNVSNPDFATEMKRNRGVVEPGVGYRDAKSEDFNIRDEVYQAFKNLENAIKQETKLIIRSEQLDQTRSKDYWSTMREITARSFERYVIDKLAETGYESDYLANIVSEEYWNAEQEVMSAFTGVKKPYPYPLKEEAEVVNKAYDNLFNVIETKETDDGKIALFSKNKLGDGKTGVSKNIVQSEIESMIKSYPGFNSYGIKVDIYAKPEDAFGSEAVRAAGAERASGAYMPASKRLVLFHSNLHNKESVRKTFRHEILVHHGLNLFEPEVKADILKAVAGTRNNILFKRVWSEIDREYSGDSESVKAEEVIARISEQEPTRLQNMIDAVSNAIVSILRKVGFIKKGEILSKTDIRNLVKSMSEGIREGRQQRTFPKSDNAQFSKERRFEDTTDMQEKFLDKIGRPDTKTNLKNWFDSFTENLALKVRQGVIDKYAPLLEIDKSIYGEDVVKSNTTHSSWVLARMSEAGGGALTAMLHGGRIKYNSKQKLIDVDTNSKGLLDVLGDGLGSSAEIDRFFAWIASKRAAKLLAEERENLFTKEEIAAGLLLNKGSIEGKGSRPEIYLKTFEKFKQYQNDVLDIAVDTGILSKENRADWEDQFYVPFYRVMEDQDVAGPGVFGGSLKPKEAYKKLKGGKQNLNDLLENTLMNFHHLLSNSLKNAATKQAINNAVEAGIAEQVPQSIKQKESTHVFVNGQKVFYDINNKMVYDALTMMTHSGIKGTAMDGMRWFKRIFTNFTTSSPQFIIANLIRDSLQAVAVTDGSSYNAVKNVGKGFKDYGFGISDKFTPAKMKMLASGAAFSFGYVYGRNTDDIKYGIDKQLGKVIHSVKDANSAISALNRSAIRAWDRYQQVNDATENVNRASIYNKINDDTGNELYAAFQARDLMDFSAHGSYQAIRFLTDVVPFLNARLQGLDKIYRSGIKPTGNVLFDMFRSEGEKRSSVTDKQLAYRFSIVTGALIMATMALRAANEDDEDYRKLEDWQKDSYWFFSVGDNGFFIPKPFEVGAIATVAERIMEQAISDHPEIDSDLFWSRIGHMFGDTFSFDPTPQIVKPLSEVMQNENSFTNRPIEPVYARENLSPERLYGAHSSEIGKLVSRMTPWLGEYQPSAYQVDHLINGYFGWLGSTMNGHVDTIVRAVQGKDSPDKDWYEYQPARRFYRNLDKPTYTKYGTMFYDYLKESNRIYSDIKAMQKEGLDYKEYLDDNLDTLKYRKMLNSANRNITTINNRMKMIRRSNMPGDVKRQELDLLQTRKNQLQEMVVKKVIGN